MHSFICYVVYLVIHATVANLNLFWLKILGNLWKIFTVATFKLSLVLFYGVRHHIWAPKKGIKHETPQTSVSFCNVNVLSP